MLVKDLKHARAVFKRLCVGYTVIDTETVADPKYKDKEDALVIGRARVKIWSMCREGESYSFPTNLFDPLYPTMAEYAEELAPYFDDPSLTVVFHNANYDLNVFRTTTCIKKWRKFWDTMIGAWMANVAIEKGLKARAPLYGRNLGSLYITKEMQKKGFSAVSMDVLEQVAEYAEGDVIATDELYQMQTKGYVMRPRYISYLKANGCILRVANPMPPGKLVVEGEGPLSDFRKNWINYHELPYLRATIRAETRGFPVDLKKLQSIRLQCAKDKDEVVKELYRAAGEKLNLNSSKQIVEKLFTPNGVEPRMKTRKGNVCLNAGALFMMREDHPLIAKLEKYRRLDKLQQVYLGNPEKGTNGIEHFVAEDGRIHCTLNTIGAVTGRSSASNPNLQQLPSQKDIYHLKECFVAPKGMKLICLDHAQLELRVMALLSKDPVMSKILSDPKGDIHQHTADEFGVARNPTAKQLNFLMLYGGGGNMLANKLTLEGVPTTKQQGWAYLERYAQVYCRVPLYRKELLAFHQEHGYVKLLTGRRRWLNDINWEDDWSVHQAETTLSNNTVQGTGQDLLKASIIRSDPVCPNYDAVLPTKINMPKEHRLVLKDYARRIEKYRNLFRKTKTVWILQVHDEVIYFTEASAAQEVGQAIGEIMTWRHFFPATTDYSVPLIAEGGVGDSWGVAKSKNPEIKLHAGI
jgi:DNA polymerase I-like protein with 3'-5' exonuclease and polymerase domains